MITVEVLSMARTSTVFYFKTRVFMIRTLLMCCLCVLASLSLKAQDTLWVKQKDGKPYLVHKVKAGEDLFLLAKKYAVPPAVLADLNDVNYQDGLSAGTKFRIPVDNYNFIRIESVVQSRPIYYLLPCRRRR
ncbi:MAG: LysM peptidoglycan-binding domain-containing protein [Sphingobacteriales bacterium]|nr:MAG: LysM peptidoglycan-binding domain-containing protein [Sphingobacteriales bacterium]